MFSGVVIYARCERWCGDLAVQQARSALEKRKVSAAVPLTGARLAHIDAVYITRYNLLTKRLYMISHKLLMLHALRFEWVV